MWQIHYVTLFTSQFTGDIFFVDLLEWRMSYLKALFVFN